MALFQSPQQELLPQLLQQLPPQLVPAPKFAFKRREILPLKAKDNGSCDLGQYSINILT
ncbi:MAG: hypothetical protein AAGE59_33140 [Cyanobacteria bacterium P01_F01_bin.86]